jgi:hypothetical protein
MNAEGAELEKILQSFCSGLDDYMQLAGDAGDDDNIQEFLTTYAVIENYLFIVKKKKDLTPSQRNHIRMDMKHCVGLADYFN